MSVSRASCLWPDFECKEGTAGLVGDVGRLVVGLAPVRAFAIFEAGKWLRSVVGSL